MLTGRERVVLVHPWRETYATPYMHQFIFGSWHARICKQHV